MPFEEEASTRSRYLVVEQRVLAPQLKVWLAQEAGAQRLLGIVSFEYFMLLKARTSRRCWSPCR